MGRITSPLGYPPERVSARRLGGGERSSPSQEGGQRETKTEIEVLSLYLSPCFPPSRAAPEVSRFAHHEPLDFVANGLGAVCGEEVEPARIRPVGEDASS